MPSFRRVPPVYAGIPASALWHAARATIGHRAADVEAEATQALGARYPGRRVVLTESGTAALTMALEASATAGARGALVALPAYACPDVGTAVLGAGGRIALYDVEPRTLAPDLASVRRCLALGATHLVADHGAVLVEDAAQHAGGTWLGVRGGALADWSILSFGRGKGLNAGGGGALLSRASAGPDRDLADRARGALPRPSRGTSVGTVLATIGTECWSHPRLYWLPAALPALRLGDTVYHPPSAPRGMRTTSAALVASALDGEAAALAARRAADAWYREQLHGLPVLLDPPPADMHTGALRFPVHLSPAVGATLGAFGVARAYPRTLADYPELVPHLVNAGDPMPGARALAATLHTLPTHRRASLADRQRLVRALRDLTR